MTHSSRTVGDMTHDAFIWELARSCGKLLVQRKWAAKIGHDSFIWEVTLSCGTWLFYMVHVSPNADMGHDLVMWDMTLSYGTVLIYTVLVSFRVSGLLIWELTHSCGTCHIHMGHDSLL